MAYLRGYHSSSATTLHVNDTTEMPVNGGVIQIEDEVIRYETATDIALLGCVRGYQNTSNVAHEDSTAIELLTVTVPTFQPTEFYASGAPTDNLTGVAIANVGDRYTDSDSGTVYINTDNSDTPTWVELGSGGGGGLPDGLEWDNSYLIMNEDGYIESNGDILIGFDSKATLFMQMIPAADTIELQTAAAGGITLNTGSLVANLQANANFQMNNSAETITFSGTGDQYVMFDLETGVRFPVMTTTNRDAIEHPQNGMIIVNATTNKINYYSGDTWRATA